MKMKRIAGILTSVLAGAVIISSSVLASWNVTGRSINILSMSSYKTSIVEEYEVPESVYPSDEISKVVNIKNDGTVDTFVRVKVEKKWGVRGDDGVLVQDTSLDPEKIIIEYNDKLWENKGDYWYYKGVLKAGEMTKEPLFESYKLSEETGNEYKGKDADIVVTMDSVQAEGSVISKAWGISARELGVIYVKGAEKSEPTGVTYKNHKIIFDAEDTDLFANFKNLLPGCSRTQIVRVKNASSNVIDVLLRAEATKQDTKEEALVKMLLSKYAKIEVKNGTELIYKGPVDGLSSTSGYTMASDIDLGKISSNAYTNLTITLTVDPDMETEYQSLLGKVSWVFTVNEEDKKDNTKEDDKNKDSSGGGSYSGGYGGGSGTSPISHDNSVSAIVPKTGDNTDITLQVILAIGSVLVLVVGLKLVGKKEE